MDVKNTVEIYDFVIALLKDAAAARADGDGITTWEVIRMAVSNAPEAIRAGMGADLVVVELKELDKAEATLIANKSIELSKAVMAFFAKV